MNTWVPMVIGAMVVVAVLVLIVALVTGRRKRTERLKQRFGPEYDRTVSAAGKQGVAERELAARERRRDELDIVALPPAALQEYGVRWRHVQTAFVDDPAGALVEADGLVTEVMRDRGYPIEDFDQRAEDISVDHPTIVENYRAAHGVQVSQRSETEQQRQAFVHYRALFTTLLDDSEANPATTQEASA